MILNSIVAGQLLADGEPPTGFVDEPLLFRDGPNSSDPLLDPQPVASWAPIFDLAAYGLQEDIYVLGVEADSADGGRDRTHDFHWFDTDTINTTTDVPVATTADAPQISYNGSNTGATGMVGSGKSILIGQAISGGIGPSSAGYRAKGVPYAAVDMTGATQQAVDTAISFSFPWYGQTKTQVWVREDGTISSSDGSPTVPANPGSNNADLSRTPQSVEPARPTDPMIAALWEDLTSGSGQVLKKFTDVDGDGQQDLVVQWTDFVYADDSAFQDTITFQAILYGNGSIQFNYIDIDSYSDNNGELTIENTGGVGATVGIWSGSADAVTLPAGTFVPGPHSIQTDSSGETSDSYIRMAWDTGGAAWDIGVVDAFGLNSPEANALRNALIDSLGDQILRAAAAGKVFHSDEVLVAVNYGGNTLSGEGFGEDTGDTVNTRLTTTTSIDTTSNSIPLVGSPAVKAQQVFRSARTGDTTNFQSDDIHLTFPSLANGTYIVELFFAEIDVSHASIGNRVFDVLVEGKTVLNDYDIVADHAKIDSNFSSIENDSVAAGMFTGIVKRFKVDVSNADGAAGLQIDLLAEEGDPIINDLRILRADAPRVNDAVIKGSDWADGVDYSYADVIPAGNQLRPMYRTGAGPDRNSLHRSRNDTERQFGAVGGWTNSRFTVADFRLLQPHVFRGDVESVVATGRQVCISTQRRDGRRGE